MLPLCYAAVPTLFMCLVAWAEKNDTNVMRSKSFNERFPRSTKVCFLMELCRVDIRPFDRQRPLDAVSYFSEILRRVLWELLKLMEKKLKCSKKAKWMSSNMNLWDISFYLEGCYWITSFLLKVMDFSTKNDFACLTYNSSFRRWKASWRLVSTSD